MRVSIRCIIYSIIALAFFRPASYILGTSLNRIWSAYTIAVSAVCIMFFVLTRTQKTARRWGGGLLFLSVSFLHCFIVSSVLNSNIANFEYAFKYFVTLSGFICFVCIGLERSPKAFFIGYLRIGLLMTLIHLYTILRYQGTGGMRTGTSMSLGRSYSGNWFFLTHANGSFFTVFPVMIVFFVWAYEFNRKMVKFAYAYLVLALVCFFVQWSVAGLVGFGIFAFLLVIDSLQSRNIRRITAKLLDLRFVVVITVIAESILAYSMGLSRLTDFLFVVFSKSQSIYARLRVWDKSVQYIKQRFIIGNGWEYETISVARITRSHTHNILLEFLYRGGIIGSFLFVLALFLLQSKQNKLRKQGGLKYDLSNVKSYRILLLSVIPFIAVSTFDFYLYMFHPLIIYILLLFYCSGYGVRYGNDNKV